MHEANLKYDLTSFLLYNKALISCPIYTSKQKNQYPGKKQNVKGKIKQKNKIPL